jgi:hypothetical protein
MTASKRRPKPVARVAKDQASVAVRRAIRALNRFYGIGRESLGRYPERMKYGAMGAEARAAKRHPEMLRKARSFADAYSAREFEQLLSLAQDQECRLGVSLIIRLLTVRSADRPALQRQVIGGHWSHSKLEAEIRKRYGNRRPAAGRLQPQPHDPQEAMLQAARHCDHWQRFLLSLCEPAKDNSARRDRLLRKDLPRPVRQRLEQVACAIKKLEGTVSKALARKGVKGPNRT